LRAEGLELVSTRVETREAFLQALKEFQPDLIISDYSMPEFDGMQALKLTQELHRNIPFIVLTGSRNEDTAVECIKAGAYDYVIKEHMHRLPFAVKEALKQQLVRKEKEQAEEQLRASEVRYRGLFEDSPISLWEEDFSAVKRRIDELRAGGVKDFDAYFFEHPEEVRACAELVIVVDVNKVTLEMFGAASKADMVANLALLIPSEHVDNLRNEMALIAAGKTQFNTEAINHTLDGRIIHLNLNWSAVPGYIDDLSKVIVSMVDVTARKQAEEDLLKKMDELQRFQRLTVGRELKMIELKQEVNDLLVKMGQPAKYRIAE
jgi:PAS domain S-box-containing protein